MSSRSYTDPITGFSMIGGFDAERYLSWLIDRPVAFPNPALPSFLHEFTHVWCNDSLVGQALALVRERASRRAFGVGQHTRDEILADLARYEAAAILLRPLGEGLALFAEFDAKPGHAQSLSFTSSAMLACFGRSGSDTNTMICEPLQLMRRQRSVVDRKANVLASPFIDEEGYLCGYMAVKGLHNRLAGTHQLFADRDFALSYIRRFIFGDAELALLILDERREDRPGASIPHLWNRVAERLSMLATAPDLNERATRFDAMAARYETAADFHTSEFSESVYLSLSASEAAGRMVMNEIRNQAVFVSQRSDNVEEIERYLTVSHLDRHFVEMGQLSVDVRTEPDGSVIALPTSNPMLHITLDETNGLEQGPAVLKIFTSTRTALLGLVVTTQKGAWIAVARSIPDLGLVGRTALKLAATYRGAIETVHEIMEENLEAISSLLELAPALNRVRKTSQERIEQICATCAALLVPEHSVRQIIEALYNGGLPPFLGARAAAKLEALAAIGLVADGAPVEYGGAIKAVEEFGLSGQAARELIELSRPLGLPLVARKGDFIYAFV